MYYLREKLEIENEISEFAETDILWLDIEVADYNTKQPRLSIIQLLAYPHDVNGSRSCILDVLDRSDLIELFINKIMANEQIIKVFHNASHDLRFLGSKKAQNVICTLEMARSIPYYLLPVKSYSLKSLTEALTDFKKISKDEQTSDWGLRPLSQKQLGYAKMEPVYLAQVYLKLLELQEKTKPDPRIDDLDIIGQRYQQIEETWRLLDSEINHLKERGKKAMQAQNKRETITFKLSSSERTTFKIDFAELVELVKNKGIDLHFSVTLTKKIQEKISSYLDELVLDENTITVSRLISKNK
jgi:ribonuclease D